jgi:hypothetical protein
MERPVGRILESVFSGSNAELMRAVGPLYLTGSVVDVTYGEGKWWDLFKPDPFTAHDLYKLDGVDFRALPEDDKSVDTVVYDPPYVLSGGKSGLDFQNRYGLGRSNLREVSQAAGGAKSLDALICAGLTECCRVARQWVLVKCMEYAQGGASGGKRNDFRDVPTIVTNAALGVGWSKHDQIVHFTGTGPGGHNIFEVRRARRAHSYLLVFRPEAGAA